MSIFRRAHYQWLADFARQNLSSDQTALLCRALDEESQAFKATRFMQRVQYGDQPNPARKRAANKKPKPQTSG